jgi:hypothetical protein
VGKHKTLQEQTEKLEKRLNELGNRFKNSERKTRLGTPDQHTAFVTAVLGQVRQWLKSDGPASDSAQRAELVNACSYEERTGAQLDNWDDLLVLRANIPGLKNNYPGGMKILLDPGSTISAINRKLVSEEPEIQKKKTAVDINVVYANSSSQKLDSAYEGLYIIEKGRDTPLQPTRLYEMALPKGYHFLFGLDWWKKHKANIDWDTGEFVWKSTKPTGEKSHRTMNILKTSTLEKIPSADMTGEMSQKQMKKILKQNPKLVCQIQVKERTPAWRKVAGLKAVPMFENAMTKSETVAHAAKQDSLIRKRLEAILQKQEGQPEPETDPHANGRPKLFMDQPETGYPVIDTELKRAHKQGRFTTELTPDIVKRQSESRRTQKDLPVFLKWIYP